MTKVEIGFREVADPYDGEPLVVAVNVRSDMVAYLFEHRSIDYAQFLAGRHFLHLVEDSEGAAALVSDPMREPVDCSRPSYAPPDYRLDAARELKRLSLRLGRRDYDLARRYIALDVEAYPAPRSQRDQDYQYRRLRDVLEDLADILGYTQKKA